MTSNPLYDKSIAVRTFLRPLEPYLQASQVSELAIVRPRELFTREYGAWHQHDCPTLTLDHQQALCNALTVYNGLGHAPILSVLLPDGERGQLVQPPATLDGNMAINIRKHTQLVKHLEDLAAEGAFEAVNDNLANQTINGLSQIDNKLLTLKNTGQIPEFLHTAIQAKKNIVIAGATGSGKTTFARSLIERVPVDERIITIEDVHELILPNHRNLVHMMYGGTRGRVTASDCIAACMRLSPDRIFLAELRGGEAWEYLTALNTGHPGSITTTHANSASDTFNRLAMLVKQSPTGGQLDMATIQSFLRNTVDIVLYFEKFKLRDIFYEPQRY